MSQGKVAVCQGVKELSLNMLRVTGTYAINIFVAIGVDRPAASGTRITTAIATTFTTTHIHLYNHQ